ncbi:MAG: peptidylprolyl isomerase [Candidatus Solibacter sp.]|nr:peptidylprolyl isomerase [Candidatus Solibacter sp.]
MFRRFVVLIASSLAVCAAADNVKVVEEIAAKVNGDIITRGELARKRLEIEAEAKRQGLSGPRLQEAVTEYFANALRDEIDTLLLVQKGKDLNINVDSEVTRRLAEIQVQQKISDPDKFQAFIRENTGMTFEDFKLQMKNQMLTQRVIGQEVARNVIVPEAEIQKYYDEHKSEYMRKESQVFLSQIVISTEGKTPAQVAVAEKKATDLAARAKKGEKFQELARDNSDDVETAKNGGQVGPMTKGLMDKPIEDLVFNAKKGFVSDPIRRPNSFLILKVDERVEAGQAPFEEAKADIQERLTQPKMEGKVRIFLTALREDAFLEIKEGYMDSGAAPAKDTRWKDVAQLKPQTTTKEEVAARRKRHLLWVIPAGTVKETRPKTAPAPPSAPAATANKAADLAAVPEKK